MKRKQTFKNIGFIVLGITLYGFVISIRFDTVESIIMAETGSALLLAGGLWFLVNMKGRV
ncbi:hypothetical protein [Paenibacillus sp. MBLB4367]|uniref:hypothetical protein n=1 Tax=Paenibacillus sp. MBLB4367 TaxID=3384767 RepID=UPI003907EFE3